MLHYLYTTEVNGYYMQYQYATGTAAETPLTGTKTPFLRGKIQRIGTQLLVSHALQYCLDTYGTNLLPAMRLSWLPLSPFSSRWITIQLLVGQGKFRRHPAGKKAFSNKLNETVLFKLD